MNRNITAVILIVLAVGIYVTFTQKEWDKVKAIREVNNEYIQAIENADRLIKVRNKVLNDYNAISAVDKDRLNRMIPNTVDTIRLIIDVSNVAFKRGIVLQDVSAVTQDSQLHSSGPLVPGEEVIPTLTLDTVKMSFEANAPYQQFIDFMRDLESNLRIMNVTHLSMKATDTGVYTYQVELETYWIRQQ